MGDADAVRGVEPDALRRGIAGDLAGENGLHEEGLVALGRRADADEPPGLIEEEEQAVPSAKQSGLAGADGILRERPIDDGAVGLRDFERLAAVVVGGAVGGDEEWSSEFRVPSSE